MTLVTSHEGVALEAFMSRVLASMSRVVLPTFGKFPSYLVGHVKLLPIDASREEIDLYQYERLQEVIRLANRTKFYRKKFQELGVDVDRVERVSDLKLRVTRNDAENYQHLMRRKGCYLTFKAYTSGSTSEPLGISHSFSQFLPMLPFQERFYQFTGLSKKDVVLLVFPYETSSFILSVVGFSLAGFHTEFANYLDLKDQIQKLRDATVLFGHGTKILQLIQRAGEKVIENLRVVAFISETIVPAGKQFIDSKTGAKVYGVYGSIEAMCPIAITCKEGRYHLMPELVLMEIDEREDVLLTFLDKNRTTIFLRYEVGDKASWEKCNCRSRFPTFRLDAKFKHLTSQRIEEAICSSEAFKEGKISPYFDYETQVVGCKRVFKIFLEKQDETKDASVAEEIKNILLYGHKNGALGPLYALPIVEGNVMEIEVRLVKAINRIKNPRFW